MSISNLSSDSENSRNCHQLFSNQNFNSTQSTSLILNTQTTIKLSQHQNNTIYVVTMQYNL